MRRTTLTLTLALLGATLAGGIAPVPAAAQSVSPAPTKLNFQGRLAKPDGTPVADGTYSIRFSLWDVASGGTQGNNEKWSQISGNVPVRNGTFAALLSGFPAAAFASDLWLEIKVGSDAPLTPRQQLVSVAYAMKANTVPDGSITADKLANDALNNLSWLLEGNSSTNPSSHFLGTRDSQPMVFRTNNIERMRLLSNGTVSMGGSLGIGTMNPAQKLDVRGNVAIQNSLLLDAFDQPMVVRQWTPFTSGAYNGIGRWGLYMEPARLFLGVPGTDYAGISRITLGGWQENGARQDWLTVMEGGNVGIGTNDPGMSLEVAKRSYYDSPALGAAYDANHYAYLHASPGDHSLIWNNTGAMRFGTESGRGTGYVEQARIYPETAPAIDQSQTTTPLVRTNDVWQSFTPSRSTRLTELRLHIGHGVPSNLIQLLFYRGEGTNGGVFYSQNYNIPIGPRSWKTFAFNNPPFLIAGQTYTIRIVGGANMENSYANTNPYPGGRADFFANADIAFEMVMSNPGGADVQGTLNIFRSAAAPSGLVVHTQDHTGYAIRLTNTQTHYETGMMVTNDGFFQITNQATGGAFARLDSTGNWTSTSDKRRKTEIAPLDGLLDKALQLKPVSYYFKTQNREQDPNKQIGFLAQDVETLFPSLVTGTETKTLNYAGLSVVAIGALQEMQARFDKKAAEVDALRAQMDALMQRLEQLENQRR